MILKSIFLIKDFKKILFFLTTVLLVINIHYSIILFYFCSFFVLLEYILYGKKDEFKTNLKKNYQLIIYFILLCISLLYSSEKAIGLKIIEKNILFLILPLIFSMNNRVDNIFLEKKFYQALLIGVIIIFILNLFYIDLDYNLLSYYNTHKNFFKVIPGHPTYIGLFAFVSLSYYYDFNNNMKIKVLTHVFFLIIILFLMSRIVFLLYIFFLVLDIYHIFRNTTRIHKFIFFIIALVSLSMIFFKTPYLKERIINDTLMDLNLEDDRRLDKGASKGSSRILRYISSVELIEQNILIGTGVGDIQNELNHVYHKNKLSIAIKKNYNTHNQYLDIIIKIGSIGFTVFILIFYFSLIRSYSINNTIIILSFMLIFLVENLLGRYQGIYCFVATFNFALLRNRFTIKENPLTN